MRPIHRTRFAPIAIFAYQRTDHLRRALDALETCPEFSESPVFVFSDGPKNSAAADKVAAVRAMLQGRRRPNMTIIVSAGNLGLAQSVTSGVTKLCDEFGRAIVIEDDLLVSPCALKWLNESLDRYEDDESVWQVSADQYRVPAFAKRQEGVFLHYTTSWGWATWKRAWDRYDPSAKGWEALKTDKELRHRFDMGRAYPFADMLLRQMTGQVDSWAIRWQWSMFSANALGLFPPRSLVSNIGLDETATHSAFGRLKQLFVHSPSVAREIICPSVPAELKFSAEDAALFNKALRRMWWATRARAWLRGLL